MNDIIERVDRIVVGLSKTKKTLSGDKRLVEDLGFDSLAIMELVAAIEDEFDVCIPANKVSNINTMKQLYTALQQKDQYTI